MPQVAVLEYFDAERLDALLVGVARALPAEQCDVSEVAVLISGGGFTVNAELLAGWPEARAVGTLRRVSGSVLGVIGLGNIGSLVAHDGRLRGMRVLASDPVASDEA